jgi:hypothetical protein
VSATTASARSALTRLADVASDHCSGDAVAIVRGFDRSSRLRARELGRKLARRGVPSVDLSPLHASMRRLGPAPRGPRLVTDDGNIGVVVDASSQSPHARRLAAELGVPVVGRRAGSGPSRHSVVGVFSSGTLVGVALHVAAVRPLDEDVCRLAVSVDDQPPCLTAGSLMVELHHPDVGRAEALTVMTREQALEVSGDLRVASQSGPYALVLDGSPALPVEGPLVMRCLVDRLEEISV